MFLSLASGVQAVVFFPCFSDGAMDARMLHEAMPAKSIKWVSQVRERMRACLHAWSSELVVGTACRRGSLTPPVCAADLGETVHVPRVHWALKRASDIGVLVCKHPKCDDQFHRLESIYY